MSRFRTTLAIPVQAILDALPKNSFVHGQTYDKEKQQLVIEWEQQELHTGYTFPVDFPAQDLLANRLPKSFRLKKAPKTPPAPEKPATVKLEGKEVPSVPVPDYHWDKERFDAEVAKGTVLEFQGVSPTWMPVDSEHVYTEGFFYRKCAIPEPDQAAT